MDLTPPHRSRFRHQNRLHFRYDNLSHTPSFAPPPFPHHLPPPPPPPPPPPSLHSFSPPRYPVIERSSLYEFNPSPKPNLDFKEIPPPPPPPHRLDLPLRFNHDYQDRNHILGRGRFDHVIDRLPRENLPWGAQLNYKDSEDGVYVRYRSISSSGRPLYDDGNAERRWDIDNRPHDQWNERSIDHNRIGYRLNDRTQELSNGRNDNPRRWGDSTNNRFYGLRKNEVDDERRWGYGTTNRRACESHKERDADWRRRDYGINGWDAIDHDRRIRGYGIHDRSFLESDNRQQECLDRDLGSGRFRGMFGSGSRKRDSIRNKKKRKVQRVSSSDRIESGKACKRRTGDYHHQHISKEIRSDRFGGEGKEGLEELVTRTEDKKESECSPLELVISFKSNALVAEAILTTSPSVNSDMGVMPRNSNIGEENSIPFSPVANNYYVKPIVSTCGSGSGSDAHGISEELLEKSTVPESGSMITCDSKILGDNVENEPQDDSITLKMTSDRGEISSDRVGTNTTLEEIQEVPDIVLVSQKLDVEGYPNIPSCPLKRKRSSLATLPDSLHVVDNMVSWCPGHQERLLTIPKDSYLECQLEIDGVERRTDETVLATEDIGHGNSLGFGQQSDSVDISEREPGEIEETPTFTVAYLCGGTMSGEVKVDKENFSCSGRGKALEDSNKFLDKDDLAKDATGLSDPKDNEQYDTVDFSEGEVAQVRAKDLITGAGVKVSLENSCEDDGSSSEGAFGVENLSLGVDFDEEGSSPVFRKKRKVSWSPLLEDDFIVDAFTNNRTKLDPSSPSLLDMKASKREGTHSPAVSAADKCGTSVEEVRYCKDNFSSSDMGKALDDGNNVVMKDNLALEEDLTSCSNNNVCSPNSNDELTDSDSDPEDLLSFSDFSLPSNPKASPSQPRNRILYGAEKRFNRKLVSAYPNNTFSLGKSVRKATSGSVQTVAKIPLPVSQSTRQVVQNLNPVHKKLTLKKSQLTSAVPNVFPHPTNSHTSRDFSSTHVTKSRTWHRTGSSAVATAETKLQPSPLPPTLAAKMPTIAQSSYLRTGSSAVATAGTKLQPSPLPPTHAAKMPTTAGTKLQPSPLPPTLAAKMSTIAQSSYLRKGNSLVRKSSPSTIPPPGFPSVRSSVYKRNPGIDNLKKTQPSTGKIDGVDAPTLHRIEPVHICESSKAPPLSHGGKSLKSTTCNLGESSSANFCSSKPFGALDMIKKSSAISENGQNGSCNNSDSQNRLDEMNSRKKINYVKRRSNQLVAASDFEDESILVVDKIQSSISDGYFKSRKNQLVRASVENHATNGDAVAAAEVNLSKQLVPKELPSRSSRKRPSSKGFSRTYRSSKLSFVWKLHDVHTSPKHNHPERSRTVLSQLFPWKRATYRRSVMFALGSKSNNFTESQKVLLSRKRGAVYTRSTHGYSLKMSKILSVGGSSLKWSKSAEKISKKTNEEATRAVAAAENRKKEKRVAVPNFSKSRNFVSRERIFRIGSERYKMDPSRRTLCRITEESPSSSIVIQPEKSVKRSYVPRRLFIGNDEYVRIGTGNQLIRDPKKRTRVLASEKIRWSLRTARMRLARNRKYCQFFTRFGKCNKEDGKCPYIHDPSKIAVCTKFLNGSCSIPDCKLTHKIIPERMQDCSYFVKGSCSNENCPYRHVNVDPDSSVCESFLRGYCIDGNECRKKHTYVCPAFEETGICPQASACKLHHPKKKTENKPKSEQKIVLGRYFDGGLIDVADSSTATYEELSAKGKDDIVHSEGKYPDYISLDVRDDEV